MNAFRISADLLTYLLSLLLLWVWLRRRPVRTLRAAFGLWWAGTLLYSLPALARFVITASRAHLDAVSAPLPAALMVVVQWVGSLLLLRAALTLILWERGRPRVRGLLVASVILAVLLGFVIGALAGLLCLPWVFSFRWRKQLSTGRLGWVSLTFLATLFLLAHRGVPGAQPALPAGLQGLWNAARLSPGLAWFYALLGLPIALLQIPFSYRRIRGRLALSHLLTAVVPASMAVVILLAVTTIASHVQRGRAIERLFVRETLRTEGEVRGLLPLLEAGASSIDRTSAERLALVLRGPDGSIRTWGVPAGFPADSLLLQDVPSRSAPLLYDGRTLFIRGRVDALLASGALRAEGLREVDSVLIASLSGVAGVPFDVRLVGGNIQAMVSSTAGLELTITEQEIPGVPMRRIPAAAPGMHGFLGWQEIPCLLRTPSGWRVENINARFPLPLLDPVLGLSSLKATDSTQRGLAILLIALLGLYVLTVVALARMVWRMGHATIRPIHELTRATAALAAGRLDHRIPVRGEDELWAVARSFNSMTENLARMREIELHAQRLEEELRLAHEIQARLLPAGPPTVPGFDLAGLSLPAREVGGDYFDYLEFPNGNVGLVVADVSGKGIPAALLMSAFRAALKTQDLPGLGPGEVLSRLNGYVHASVDPGKFITAFLGLLDPATGELRYASAGHDPPLMLQADGDRSAVATGGLVLGILPHMSYDEHVVRMADGTLLLAFTDGVTEAQNVAGEFFGEDALFELVQRRRAEKTIDLARGIVSEVRTFSGTALQSDDITLLIARRGYA